MLGIKEHHAVSGKHCPTQQLRDSISVLVCDGLDQIILKSSPLGLSTQNSLSFNPPQEGVEDIQVDPYKKKTGIDSLNQWNSDRLIGIIISQNELQHVFISLIVYQYINE